MARMGGNWVIGTAFGALAIGAFAAAAAMAGRSGEPACVDQSAAAPDARPGFDSFTQTASPACIRVRLR